MTFALFRLLQSSPAVDELSRTSENPLASQHVGTNLKIRISGET